MSAFEPGEFVKIERDEQEARQRLAEAREQQKMDEGEAAHEGPLEKLEDEWKKARERLDEALHRKKD
jgi:hypothetical protein